MQLGKVKNHLSISIQQVWDSTCIVARVRRDMRVGSVMYAWVFEIPLVLLVVQ